MDESIESPKWSNPWYVVIATTLFFSAVRCAFGGAPYLCSRAWYALCMFIPFPFVATGAGLGALCVPLIFDWNVAFHLGLVLVYCQFDLLIGGKWIEKEYGSTANFDNPNIFKIILQNFHPLQSRTPMDVGCPALVRSVFEFNGALLHEVFWNIYVCQNFIDHGYHSAIAILMVPMLSSVVHALTCNWVQGYRCFPQFLWVALSYHASQNVLVPALIHAMWYLCDGQLLITMSIFKKNWDIEKRVNESRTPHADKYFWAGFLLIIAFYGSLELLIEMVKPYFQLYSSDLHIATCPYGKAVWPFGPVSSPVELYVVYASLVQFLIGFGTWQVVRAGMDPLAEDGDLSEHGKQRFGMLVEEAAKRQLQALGCLKLGEEMPLDLDAGDPKTQNFT